MGACGNWNLIVHVLLAWRQAAMAATVESTKARLQSAFVLLQTLSRAFFAALRYWEGRATSLPSSSTDMTTGAAAAASAAAARAATQLSQSSLQQLTDQQLSQLNSMVSASRSTQK